MPPTHLGLVTQGREDLRGVVTATPQQVFDAISALCAVLFLLYLPVRLRKLRASRPNPISSWRGLPKAVIGVSLSIVLLAYLAKPHVSPAQTETTATVSLAVSLVAALGLSLLLFMESRRSSTPSDLATLYLLASAACDAVLLTMPPGEHAHLESRNPLIARLVMHLMLLILESCGKRPAQSGNTDSGGSCEESHGVLSRVFFIWINPILRRGYRNILGPQDLPPLGKDMKPGLMRKTILRTWTQRAKPETKRALPLAVLKCTRSPFLAAIVPRLFLIVFRYSQPVLIKQSIRFVTMAPTNTVGNYGYWLILSAATVYLGLAISTAVYQHALNRLKVITKSAPVGLIHHKMMNSPNTTYDNGEATTLMSTDVDGLEGIGEMFHETLAQVLEVIIGVVLLAGEVGWIWPLPLFLVYLCSYVSRYVAKHLRPRQKDWNTATQSRVAATSSLLSHMKVVKMLGFQHHLAYRIQQLREVELSVASKVRWMMVYYNASANALGIFSPAITLVLSAIITAAHGNNLDTETAFTTVAILGMITHPANMVMTIVPRAVAAFASFDRIQSFLLRPPLRDQRGSILKANTRAPDIEPASSQLTTHHSSAIVIRNLTIGEKALILGNINIEVAQGSLTVISGPVGSGKSTLLRAILGEVAPIRGSIKLSTKQIAYCAQRSWLPNGSIKEVIHGMAGRGDAQWYRKVVDACCLTHDFYSLPDGDDAQVGSKGLNLSGGQRQRVALARALFARCDIALLDDAFSALDGETENHVFNNLFGPRGLFRQLKTTVVLVANSSHHFPVADHIVILGECGVKEQGSWQSIKAKSAAITKFVPNIRNQPGSTPSANSNRLQAELRARDEAEVDLARKTGDFSLYGYYFRFVGLVNLLLIVGCTASYSFSITTPQLWLQLWMESGNGNTVFYTCGYMFLSLMSWSSTNGIMWSTVIRIAPQSGIRLHHRLLDIVTRAPLSYFSNTDNGSILNRFSQDIQLLDKQLPSALANTTNQIFKLLMQAALLLMAQKYLALSLPACVVLVYVIQKVYLRTSRQLRFLELESRAAVFSSFLESAEGLETIRAFGWRREAARENIVRVENSQRPEFLLLSLQRWLNVVLDLLAAAMATGVIAIAVALRGQVSGGQIGVALNVMLVANTTLLRLVESWTTLEVSLGAVSRLKTLERNVPPEDRIEENCEPPANWPSRGRIKFRGVTAAYHADAIALRDINLDIAAGQRLILCGRTGSGKSSLLLTLLRMLELRSGSIEVDDIDISRLPRDTIRRRCFVTVSQDALLLSNETLRSNLDPDGMLSDDAIVRALERTALWQHFIKGDKGPAGSVSEPTVPGDLAAFRDHPVLDREVSSFPELSVGQCQLFALSRAILKVNVLRNDGVQPIILLDEVTAALDHATESTLHGVIDQEFTAAGHTVITVTHRVGVLREYARPGRDTLVELRDGRVYDVVIEMGTNISSDSSQTF
ncbi:putative ABC transporter [Durotheca rogersii]|uniref:putative ABC transporter n=1 Tax=Durotheca rogersii TaxID=419775 RepID=UPI00221FAA62|nr:putative ABC transporter [Durotheca rogersii]KAI5860382.1 putative ABC transporter [Durotheca rogersii]